MTQFSRNEFPSCKSGRSFLPRFSQTSRLKSSTSLDILGYTQPLINTWDDQVIWSTSQGKYIEVWLLAGYLPLLEMLETKNIKLSLPQMVSCHLKESNQKSPAKKHNKVIWSLARTPPYLFFFGEDPSYQFDFWVPPTQIGYTLGKVTGRTWKWTPGKRDFLFFLKPSISGSMVPSFHGWNHVSV